MNTYALLMFAMTCAKLGAEVINTDDVTRALPVVEWSRASVTSVYNNDVLIKSNVRLPVGTTTIAATYSNLTVNFAKALKIKGSDDGQSELVFYTDESRIITVDMTENVTFVGSDNEVENPLIIRIVGRGKVIFKMHEGAVLKCGSLSSDRGSVEMYCVFSPEGIPTCIFEHHGAKQLQFNKNCKMGYQCVLGEFESPVDEGGFQFDLSHLANETIEIGCTKTLAIPLKILIVS